MKNNRTRKVLLEENKFANIELDLLYNERDDYRRALKAIRLMVKDFSPVAVAIDDVFAKHPKIDSKGAISG